jgi:hypothetical protein
VKGVTEHNDSVIGMVSKWIIVEVYDLFTEKPSFAWSLTARRPPLSFWQAS